MKIARSDRALTLCHGNDHLDNLLRDQDGTLIWADQQEVGIGYGPNDLTFLIQHAETNGANIAHDSVITTYCTALETAGVENVNENTIISAMSPNDIHDCYTGLITCVTLHLRLCNIT